jgi:hypothetical protein
MPVMCKRSDTVVAVMASQLGAAPSVNAGSRSVVDGMHVVLGG